MLCSVGYPPDTSKLEVHQINSDPIVKFVDCNLIIKFLSSLLTNIIAFLDFGDKLLTGAFFRSYGCLKRLHFEEKIFKV